MQKVRLTDQPQEREAQRHGRPHRPGSQDDCEDEPASRHSDSASANLTNNHKSSREEIETDCFLKLGRILEGSGDTRPGRQNHGELHATGGERSALSVARRATHRNPERPICINASVSNRLDAHRRGDGQEVKTVCDSSAQAVSNRSESAGRVRTNGSPCVSDHELPLTGDDLHESSVDQAGTKSVRAATRADQRTPCPQSRWES